MDLLSYFRAEVDTVGRQWREALSAFDDASARRRPAPNMNHALWLTGHIAWAEDYFVIEIPTGKSFRRKEWDRLFDVSSEKLPDDQYPPFDEVLAEFVRVHNEVLKALGALNMHQLGKPSNAQRRWFPTAAHAIASQVTHGHYHLGQLVYLSRLRAGGKL
jgi:hypothetical protein